MATKKQKEQLIEILKFTPRTYRIELGAYGGETYAGRVDRKIYDYFKSRGLGLEEFNGDWDNELAVPEDLQPFTPGSSYDCDGMGHANGATMDSDNTVEVFDETGEVTWSSTLDLASLQTAGVAVEESGSFDFGALQSGEVAVWGGSGEKGLLFGGDIELSAPFDPSKLKIRCCDADGWLLSDGVEYNGEDVSNDDYSTTGKWSEVKWILGGDEEEYESRSQHQDGEEDPGFELPASYWPTTTEELEFPFPEYKPARPGWYACYWKESYGTGSGKLYWTGTEFHDASDGEVYQWCGLNWDTTDWANCPQPKENDDD